MYVRVLQDELQFPDDRVMDQDTKSLIRGVSEPLENFIHICLYSGDSCFNATLTFAFGSLVSRSILISR